MKIKIESESVKKEQETNREKERKIIVAYKRKCKHIILKHNELSFKKRIDFVPRIGYGNPSASNSIPCMLAKYFWSQSLMAEK